MTAVKVIVLDFAKIEFFENYVVTHVNEDIVLDMGHFEVYKELFTTYYENRPYVYISNRANSYNVNPMAYIQNNVLI
ncbi:MAG TPA: hypothetical protein ENH91_08465, partial [Leeuwenhoekiella sp.]|nr:hypothetical protein [Leeuwenhoekiella sp.]